jgi:hypothetical protein
MPFFLGNSPRRLRARKLLFDKTLFTTEAGNLPGV